MGEDGAVGEGGDEVGAEVDMQITKVHEVCLISQ